MVLNESWLIQRGDSSIDCHKFTIMIALSRKFEIVSNLIMRNIFAAVMGFSVESSSNKRS